MAETTMWKSDVIIKKNPDCGACVVSVKLNFCRTVQITEKYPTTPPVRLCYDAQRQKIARSSLVPVPDVTFKIRV